MKLRWSVLAVEDRNRIFDYLAERNPVAALQLDERFSATAELLIEHPQLGRLGRIEGTRELVVGGTPYIAAYQLTGKTVIILRLLHGAQLWPEAMQPD